MLLEPDMTTFNTWDIKQLPALLEKGLRAGKAAVRPIKEAMNRFSETQASAVTTPI